MNVPLKHLILAGSDGNVGPNFPLPVMSPSPRKRPLLKFPTSLPTAVTPSHDRRGRLDQNKISRAICAILLFKLASSDHSTSSDYDFSESVK